MPETADTLNSYDGARVLEACPLTLVGWCKGGPITRYEGDSRFPAFVRCDACRTSKMAADLPKAEAAWNRRTTLSQPNEKEGELQALRAEVERLTPKPTPWDDMKGVCYRHGPITADDYDECIADMQAARKALVEGDSMGCFICSDGGCASNVCHHNALRLARKWTAATCLWKCYHCGYIATNDEEAREHFGRNECDDPACFSTTEAAQAEDEEQCQVPGCDNLTSQGICDDCELWVDQEVIKMKSDGLVEVLRRDAFLAGYREGQVDAPSDLANTSLALYLEGIETAERAALSSPEGMSDINKQHRFLIKRNADRALVGSTDDRGAVLPAGHILIDTIGEDGLGPGITRFLTGLPHDR